jgi:hypothetical protein
MDRAANRVVPETIRPLFRRHVLAIASGRRPECSGHSNHKSDGDGGAIAIDKRGTLPVGGVSGFASGDLTEPSSELFAPQRLLVRFPPKVSPLAILGAAKPRVAMSGWISKPVQPLLNERVRGKATHE